MPVSVESKDAVVVGVVVNVAANRGGQSLAEIVVDAVVAALQGYAA